MKIKAFKFFLYVKTPIFIFGIFCIFSIFCIPCSRCRKASNKKRFQQSASTHSGAGKKEFLNINVVGKPNVNECQTTKKQNTKGPQSFRHSIILKVVDLARQETHFQEPGKSKQEACQKNYTT